MNYAPPIQKLADLLEAPNLTAEQRTTILAAVDWSEYLRAALANSQWGEGAWRMKYNILKGELSGEPCLKP